MECIISLIVGGALQVTVAIYISMYVTVWHNLHCCNGTKLQFHRYENPQTEQYKLAIPCRVPTFLQNQLADLAYCFRHMHEYCQFATVHIVVSVAQCLSVNQTDRCVHTVSCRKAVPELAGPQKIDCEDL